MKFSHNLKTYLVYRFQLALKQIKSAVAVFSTTALFICLLFTMRTRTALFAFARFTFFTVAFLLRTVFTFCRAGAAFCAATTR